LSFNSFLLLDLWTLPDWIRILEDGWDYLEVMEAIDALADGRYYLEAIDALADGRDYLEAIDALADGRDYLEAIGLKRSRMDLATWIS
jgi:hypothetical protein